MEKIQFIKYATSYVSPKGNKKKRAVYKCFCGKEFESQMAHVKRGGTKSCGCLKVKVTTKRATTHGYGRHPIRVVYNNMIARCYNKNYIQYHDYGGRGIKVCERWKNSFLNFLEDNLPGYKKGLTADRFPNNNGDYEPSNFRWATRSENARNTRSNHIIEYNGEKMTGVAFCEKYNLKYWLFMDRINKGWSVEKSMTYIKHRKTVIYNNENVLVSYLAKKYNIDYQILNSRINTGWDINRAVETPVLIKGKHAPRKQLTTSTDIPY